MSKKIEKIDMHNLGFISSQNRSGQVEKERKKIIAPILPTRPWIENSKKIAKKLKNTIQAWFQAKTGREREKKKIILPNRPRIENFKKMAKKFKKLQKTIQTSFQAKTGQDSSRKREKKLSFWPFLPDPDKKIWKKRAKKFKKLKSTI